MYYTSKNKSEIEDYLNTVNSGEKYSGTTSTWSEIQEHKDGGEWAIIKHPDYTAQLTEIQSLDGWFKKEEANEN